MVITQEVLYVNHFGSLAFNDLTETIIIYDRQSGLEIIDPHDLIATANVIPSVSGNKAVFDFVIVFENEIPQSDLLFRLWDTTRNSMNLHLPDALIVEISEQSENTITVEPKSVESKVISTVPEIEPSTKTFTEEQLHVLKKWAGYDAESETDSEMLQSLGIINEDTSVSLPEWTQTDLGSLVVRDIITLDEFITSISHLLETQ